MGDEIAAAIIWSSIEDPLSFDSLPRGGENNLPTPPRVGYEIATAITWSSIEDPLSFSSLPRGGENSPTPHREDRGEWGGTANRVTHSFPSATI